MDDLISRQAAIDAFTDAVNDVGVLDAEDINAVFQRLPSVEAIPVEWITSKIARFRAMDNAFASLTASQLQALLNDWRIEQNEG